MSVIHEPLSTPQRLYGLHEAVLNALEMQLQGEEVSPKAIELAMRFLKDNNVAVDLTDRSMEKKQLALKEMASIPRLTDEELAI